MGGLRSAHCKPRPPNRVRSERRWQHARFPRQVPVPAALWGAPTEVKGDTSVVPTASCEPPQSASPFAMTSMRRSSCRATSTLRSRSRTLRATVASASRQMRAAARSTPDRGHAARWTPKRSCSCRQRQRAEVKGRGRRSRRRNNTEERRAEGQLRCRNAVASYKAATSRAWGSGPRPSKERMRA